MKNILGIIVVGLLLSGCVTETTSEFYGEVSSENKVIGISANNKYLSKGLKKLFRKKGWKVVVVDLGTVKTTGSSTGVVNTEAEYKSKTSYVVSLSQTHVPIMRSMKPIPCLVGNDQVEFDLSIINSKTGEETFVAEGNDCTKNIVKDLEDQLSSFWN